MRQFFMVVFAFFLGGCNSAKEIGGMYRLISDDPGLWRVTLEIENTRVSGQGPCNRYFGSVVQTGFIMHVIVLMLINRKSTLRACAK